MNVAFCASLIPNWLIVSLATPITADMVCEPAKSLNLSFGTDISKYKLDKE
jgi:hypothetical protein